MKISTIKCVFKYLTGGVSGVVDYLLGILNQALSKIDPDTKESIVSVINIATKVLSVLESFRWLCPTKWQIAYSKTLAAVDSVIISLEDLKVTTEELKEITKNFKEAVTEWKSDDDDTCFNCIDD